MSFGNEEEELDWGDNVDVVSLGDEDEIPRVNQVEENEVQEPASSYALQTATEAATSPTKNRSSNTSNHALGLSHLPPKPHTVVPGRRSRETIKAAAMSRPYLRSGSPPSAAHSELPRNWETRRSEHAEPQLKRPRDDGRPDRLQWEGEAPPPSDRTQSARNAPSGRAAWPERSSANHRTSTRPMSPPPGAASPPRARSPDPTPRPKSDPVPSSLPPRAMSPSSMLIPRRGQSPARGLAKNTNNTAVPGSYDPADEYPNDGRNSRTERFRDTGRERRPRTDKEVPSRKDHYSPGSPIIERSARHDDIPNNAGYFQVSRDNGRRPKDRDVPNGGLDHYSPPPEDEEGHSRHGSGQRSVSPPRRTAMRSDAMVVNQRTRRSLSPRDHANSRGYERPPLDRMASDSRINRAYGRGRAVDDGAVTRGGRRFEEREMRRGGGEYADLGDEQFRGREIRVPNQIQRLSPGTADTIRDVGPLPPDADDPRFLGPNQFRGDRFPSRPENRRQHSSRPNHAQAPRAEPPSVSPRLSPHDVRNDLPPVARREFIPPRDGPPVHVRARNGEMRERMLGVGDRDAMVQHRDIMPLDHESMPMPAEEHEMRHEERIRQHRHRHSVSREEYVVINGLPPQELHEGHLAGVSPPPRRNYPARARDFPPHEGPDPREQEFGGERDFRPREAGRFPPSEHRNRGGEQRESYPRPLPQEPIPHDYETSSLPHGRHIPLHDVEPIPPNRGYPDAEQRHDPSSNIREAYPRRYARDDQFADRTSQTWERGVEVPTPPPPEEGRHRSRRHQSDARRPQREAMSDTEYLEARGGGRSRRIAEGGRTGYDDLEVEARPRRHTIRDAKQPYDPEDRQWTPRDAPRPSLRERSPVSRMEIDVHEDGLAPPGDALPGWAEFHRRDRSPQVREVRPHRSRPGAREVWPPAPDAEHDMVGPENGIEGSKRQKVEGGTKMTSAFSRDEEELPRKVPNHSPTQRPKPHSPINSFSMLLQPAIPVPPPPPPVDIEAARARAKNVASQLSAVNPTPRTKSRFSQAAPQQAQGNTKPASLSINTRQTAIYEKMTPVEANEGQVSRLEVPRDARQGSDDSSGPLVTRMGDASLGDNERVNNPQRSGRNQRNSRWDSSSRRRDRADAENLRNGGTNGGNRAPRQGDFWRPEDDDAPRGTGMRAWNNPEPNMQRDDPPHTSFAPPNRSFVPRQAVEPNFVPMEARNRPFEGLPPRPPSPTDFVPPMPNSRGSRSRVQGNALSPQRERFFVPDAEMVDAAPDPSGSTRPLSFLSASNMQTTPRKHSLLDRMTEPSGERPLVARLSTGEQGTSDGQLNRQQRRLRANRAGTRR